MATHNRIERMESAGHPTRQKVVILGAGVFAEEVADLLSALIDCELVGFVEGLDRARCAQPLLGLPVWWVEELDALDGSCRAVCAVGAPQRRALIRQASAGGLEFMTVVHPGAYVSSTAVLGEGCIVGPGAVVAAHAVLGRHVIVNRGSLIGHHVHIGDYVTLSPGANVAGKAYIGSSTYVGMGAIVLDKKCIGSGCVIAAGAVVTRDVPDGIRVAGVPARVMEAESNGSGGGA